MTWAGVLMVLAGGVMIAFGGPVGWAFGAVYVATGADSLWFGFQLHRLRRRPPRAR